MILLNPKAKRLPRLPRTIQKTFVRLMQNYGQVSKNLCQLLEPSSYHMHIFGQMKARGAAPL